MDQPSRPSGYVLPQYLQRKRPRTTEENSSSTSTAPDDSPKSGGGSGRQTTTTRISSSEAAIRSNRVYECSELESLALQITASMIDIQKQIHRGEESYYEDTYAHGSLFRGWDAFVDAKDVPGGESSGSGGMSQPSYSYSSRRVPSDLRWFSNSCRSVSRNARPVVLRSSFIRPTASTGNMETNDNNPSPRSETNTPTGAATSAVSSTKLTSAIDPTDDQPQPHSSGAPNQPAQSEVMIPEADSPQDDAATAVDPYAISQLAGTAAEANKTPVDTTSGKKRKAGTHGSETEATKKQATEE